MEPAFLVGYDSNPNLFFNPHPTAAIPTKPKTTIGQIATQRGESKGAAKTLSICVM